MNYPQTLSHQQFFSFFLFSFCFLIITIQAKVEHILFLLLFFLAFPFELRTWKTYLPVFGGNQPLDARVKTTIRDHR